jgi:hypothetical protein
VTLTEAATAAMAAPPSSSGDAASGGGIVEQVQQLAAVLSDTSGASDADKASALASLYQLRFATGGSPTAPSLDAWFTQATPTQQQAVTTQIDQSTFFKQAVTAATQFNSAGVATARSGAPFDFSQTEWSRLSQLSPDQQLLVWAGGGSQYGTLDAFKGHLEKQAQGQAADNAAAIAAAASKDTGTDTSDPDGAAEALKTLSTKPAGTAADIALSLLTKSATAHAAAARSHHTTPAPAAASASGAAPTETPTLPSAPGTLVSVAA